jgi:hypothetical protein
MKAFASIHSARPSSQSDNEVEYEGYCRIPADCEIGSLYIQLKFPEVLENSEFVMTHVSIGPEENKDGEIFLSLSCLPHVPLKIMQSGKTPTVIITYPDTLAKSARIAHQMVALGKIKTSEMEPKFFEEVNNHLQAHGIPVLTVNRSASAGWVGKMANMPSFGGIN